MAQTALTREDTCIDALRDTIAELVTMEEPRRRLPGMLSGLDIHYDLGEGHALLGRRMPDLDLITTDAPLRVFTLLHDARPVLLKLGEPGGFDRTPLPDGVQLVDAEYEACGGFRSSARSPLPRPCWYGLTDTSPGWERAPSRGSPTLTAWFA
jgi:3-(3-hydroxy-phenyl)propionate hydroxylase